MQKRVLLLAVSCKFGGLCPGGLDLDNPSQWIRIVKDDSQAGSVQGKEIDFAKPLDIIEFDGYPVPIGKQQENWAINNNSCKNKGQPVIKGEKMSYADILNWAYEKYSYNGLWGNCLPYLTESEFNQIKDPSETIVKATKVKIYKKVYKNIKDKPAKTKIDFKFDNDKWCIGWSVTDQDFFDIAEGAEKRFDNAYLIMSISRDINWTNPSAGEKQSYKWVSRIFPV